MTDRVNDSQLDDFVRQESRSPAPTSFGGGAEARRDEAGFLVCVQFFGSRGRGSRFAVEGKAETIGDEALAKVFGGFAPAIESLGNPRIGPAGAVGIRFEKDLGTLHFLGGSFEFADYISEFLALVRSQADGVFLFHAHNLWRRIKISKV